MDIMSSSFGGVSSPYYAGNTPARQPAFAPSYGYAIPDSFQKQNQDDQQQQQQQNPEAVDYAGMVHQAGHHIHI
jgi:hypothetical protein